VQEKNDGYPLTSVATWLNPGVYNAAYDIWFNKTDAHPAQDNGTEIMIWIAHPGIHIGHISRHVIVDGIHWGVMTWTAHNNRTGSSWHYVAYVAEHQRSAVFGLWLNPFFRNAIANHELSPYWWLTGIDFGFELVRGGVGNNVHFYKLTGVS
jgi:endoglucanase